MNDGQASSGHVQTGRRVGLGDPARGGGAGAQLFAAQVLAWGLCLGVSACGGGDSGADVDTGEIRVTVSGNAHPHPLSTRWTQAGQSDFTRLQVSFFDPVAAFGAQAPPLATAPLVGDDTCPAGTLYEYDCPWTAGPINMASVQIALIMQVDDAPGAPDRWFPALNGVIDEAGIEAMKVSKQGVSNAIGFGFDRAAVGALADLVGLEAAALLSRGFIVGSVAGPDGEPLGGVTVESTQGAFNGYYLSGDLTSATASATAAEHGYFVLVPAQGGAPVTFAALSLATNGVPWSASYDIGLPAGYCLIIHKLGASAGS